MKRWQWATPPSRQVPYPQDALKASASSWSLEYCDRTASRTRAGRTVPRGVKKYADDLVDEEGGAVIYADEALASLQDDGLPADAAALPASEITGVEILDLQGQPRTTFGHGEQVLVKVAIRTRRIEQPYGIQLKSVDDIALWAGTTQNMSHGTGRLCFRLAVDVECHRQSLCAGTGHR